MTKFLLYIFINKSFSCIAYSGRQHSIFYQLIVVDHLLGISANLCGFSPGPLFLFQNGRPLSRALLTDWLRQTLASANIPSNFSSHSFRIGAATVAARNGVLDHLIQALGRWSSSAYQLYIRTPSESLAALSTKLEVPR